MKHLSRTLAVESWCGEAGDMVMIVSLADCPSCLRAYLARQLEEAVSILGRIQDKNRYGVRYQAPRHPCGCRSVGECQHSNAPTSREDKLALNRTIDAFAAELRTKLHRKVDEGMGGWDAEDWPVPDIVSALLRHVAKGDPIDVAAFAVFWWNRWVERRVPCSVGEGCDCDGYHRVDENPRARLPVGERRTRVARRKSTGRRKAP